MNTFRVTFTLFFFLLVTGCTSSGRYHQSEDSAPEFAYSKIDLSDAQPVYEEYREQNSRPYTVLGKHYTPLLSAKGFEQTGNASWYGQKFHGHLTSNGEIYDMFEMTAAHKTLPLPSFAKITNLDNNKTVIVRINDRGPFHDERIIDLSYAAATKLDIVKHGVGRVKLEAIHIDKNGEQTVGKEKRQPDFSTDDMGWYIQVAALKDKTRAHSVFQGLKNLYQVPAKLPVVNNIFKLQLGPFKDRFQVKQLLSDLKQNGFPQAYIIGGLETF